MTTEQLARVYLRKCHDRLAALDVLVQRAAFSDVVRESQEIVELALKGLLRAIGVDPPKLHDVGPLLLAHASRLRPLPAEHLAQLAQASQILRQERETSFYGDVDLLPSEEYGQADAQQAAAWAKLATETLEHWMNTPR